MSIYKFMPYVFYICYIVVHEKQKRGMEKWKRFNSAFGDAEDALNTLKTLHRSAGRQVGD